MAVWGKYEHRKGKEMTCDDCKYSFHRLWTPIGYSECELHECLMPNGFMCGDLEEKNENQNDRKSQEEAVI